MQAFSADGSITVLTILRAFYGLAIIWLTKKMLLEVSDQFIKS